MTELTIALVACPNMLATSLSFPKEMLQAAAQIARLNNKHARSIRFVMTRMSKEQNTNLGGIPFPLDCEFEALHNIDLIILPALWRSPEKAIKGAKAQQAVFQRLAQSGTRFAATGTGTWLLAETNLLSGAATTHWYYLKPFAKRYPALDVRADHLVTESNNVFCASSINSLADLTVHLIGELYDQRTAKHVQQQFSPEAREQFRERVFIQGDNNAHSDELIADAQQWLRDHHEHKVNFSTLASALKISQRTLNRRFITATGISPQVYLQQYRLNMAKDLLKQTNLSMEDIAHNTGFGTASYLSKTFQKFENCSPSTFRKSVKSKLFT